MFPCIDVRALCVAASLAFAFCLGSGAAGAKPSVCGGLSPHEEVRRSGGVRDIRLEDLARLRDIGMAGSALPDQAPFEVAPDGLHIAFTLRRAEPSNNSYCMGLYVVEIGAGNRFRQIDAGGEFIPFASDALRGLFVPSGAAAINTPRWSPDGRWVAYLKRINGVTQVWRARADGTGAEAVARPDYDADGVTWSTDGKAIVFSARPGLAISRGEITREELSGYRQDWRTIPASGPRPFAAGPIPIEYFAVDVASGKLRPASTAERSILDPTASPPDARRARLHADGRSRRAWVFSRSKADELWADDSSGIKVLCIDSACRNGIVAVWLSPDEQEVWYLRRQGWADSQIALYRWRPGAKPHMVFTADDFLMNCQAAARLLVCGRETALSPRHFVTIDPLTGQTRRIFDPNPEFSTIRLGSVRRLYWRNRYGIESYGDLVLPFSHRRGDRHPLIITQYRSRGFLRGATGDEYPIQSFAAKGFAVLSLERPERWAQAHATPGDPRSWDEFEKENNRNWADRRSVLSSLLRGVDVVKALGVVDPKRIGITGTSEGSMSLWFALNNTRNVFAAASMGSCCMDSQTLAAFGGEQWAKQLKESGFPPYSDPSGKQWIRISLARNVSHIKIPLMMQIPDEEYGLAVETAATFARYGRPVEFYVFPNEHHVIWQPAHRLAMYQRNLDWFERWLRPSAISKGP